MKSLQVVKHNNTYFTALVSPSMLSTCENIIRGALSASGISVHIISSGTSSNGGIVRIFFDFGSVGGSDKLRLTRS